MFFEPPVKYERPIYRPPAEANSLLLQVTIGCSHNKCSFCAMYRSKKYRERPLSDINKDLNLFSEFYKEQSAPRKIFLCDGDALAAPMALLVPVLEKINELFPDLRRIGVYASAGNVLEKSLEELKLLKELKLNIGYTGVESGSDEVLKLLTKGSTAAETLEAGLKLKEAGWKQSAIIMLGAGGKSLSLLHCKESADLISRISPDFLSFLTTTVVPGTPYSKMVDKKNIELLTVREILQEMKLLVEDISPRQGRIIFRANHASNQFPLEGILPRDQEKLAKRLAEWIEQCPEGLYPDTSPEDL